MTSSVYPRFLKKKRKKEKTCLHSLLISLTSLIFCFIRFSHFLRLFIHFVTFSTKCMAESFGIYMRSKAVIYVLQWPMFYTHGGLWFFPSPAKDFLVVVINIWYVFVLPNMHGQLIIIYVYRLRLLYMRDDRPQERVREKAYLSFCTLWYSSSMYMLEVKKCSSSLSSLSLCLRGAQWFSKASVLSPWVDETFISTWYIFHVFIFN
jgi:hypothetical protein